mgnify:CR=1 FL=1|tara:strand:+ start:2600 stop:3154 length:555 start_codon:yes stop_codon:yes gene_type:complete
MKDFNLDFASDEWDIGAIASSGGTTNYATDVVTLPTDTQSWDDVGAGGELNVQVSITETFVGGGTPTVTFEVGLADDNAGTNWVTIGTSGAIAEADLGAATIAETGGAPFPSGDVGTVIIKLDSLANDLAGSAQGKFLSLRAVISGSSPTNDLTAGKVKAWLGFGKGNGVQNLKHFHRSGFTMP